MLHAAGVEASFCQKGTRTNGTRETRHAVPGFVLRIAVLRTGPAFEVASVKLASGAGFDGPQVRTAHGTLTLHKLPLRECIRWAYQVQAVQVIGADWLDDVKLDVVAKAGSPVEDPQLFVMLRTLLGERLGVKVHFERKEIPVYALVIGKHR